MNSTNQTSQGNQTLSQTAWEESGAMVYVALTVATISAIIMCCTWFVRQKWFLKGYNNVRSTEHVELNQMDDEEDEEIPLVSGTTPPENVSPTDTSAFTLSASDSDAADSENSDNESKGSDRESMAEQSAAEEIAV